MIWIVCKGHETASVSAGLNVKDIINVIFCKGNDIYETIAALK